MSTLVEPIAQEAIQSYKESITFLAENEIDYRFLNSGVTHATIVISRIFKHAKKNVVLYAKVLSGDISNREEVRQQIIHFLEKKDTKLHVVIDDVTRHDNGIWEIFKQHSQKVFVRQASEIFINKVSNLFKNNIDTYFMVGDKKMYRLEYDNQKHAAQCNFNDESTSKKLTSIFNSNYESCKLVNI